MQIYSGKEKVAEYRGKNLVIDFDDLFKYKGERYFKDLVERQLARILFLVGSLIFLVGVFLIINAADAITLSRLLNPAEPSFLLPFLSIPFFLYSAYLSRDKTEFEFNLENLDLRNAFKTKAKDIELDNYFSENMLSLIDKLFYAEEQGFILGLSLALLSRRDIANFIEKRVGIDPNLFKKSVASNLNSTNTSFKVNYKDFFLYAFNFAEKLGLRNIDELVLTLIMCKKYWTNALEQFDINELDIEALSEWLKNDNKQREYKKLWKSLLHLKPKGAINKAFTSKATIHVDYFSTDLTNWATHKESFKVSIGKEEVMQEMFRVLERKNDPFVILIGEPGVGKTYFIEYLATRMVVEDVPDRLKDKRLISLDINKVMVKSESIDKFKTNLSEILQEVAGAKNIVLVIEEIDQIFALRNEARAEVVNLLTTYLINNKIPIIGTTNSEGYTRRIKQFQGFFSLFETLDLSEPDNNLAAQIILGEVDHFEAEYKINIPGSVVRHLVTISKQVESEKHMPMKGINLLEEALVFATHKGLKNLDANTVDMFFKAKYGVAVGAVTRKESEVLLDLQDKLHERVVGQDKAISAIAAAIKRVRSGIRRSNKPIATFLFYGPTGVGKTEAAKTLANSYFGSEDLMLRLDMSEYQEAENLNRLIGYTDSEGNFIEGDLTGAVRKKPFSLVLLDEIEKANPKVLDLFLQVLDEGYVVDGVGKKVDFTNTIIIATSNAGSKQIAELSAKGVGYNEIEKISGKILFDFFRVEFLNRFDKVIMFRYLSQVEVEKIAELMLTSLKKQLSDNKNVDLEWNNSVIEELVKEGYSPVYGARELRRVVQDELENKIADLIIQNELQPGHRIEFNSLQTFNIT